MRNDRGAALKISPCSRDDSQGGTGDSQNTIPHCAVAAASLLMS
ncbi:MAG: hypothetical protein PF442_10465 [Desulfobulbaceae bacterium]|nr:hypothetical protein [Desulfobulbaceae bacterium]